MAEYCLLTALLTLIAAGIFVHSAGGVQAIWAGANISLTTGNTAGTAASSGSSTQASAPATQ